MASNTKIKVITCKGCGKTPEELIEYEFQAEEEGCTPTEWVMQNEGTYQFPSFKGKHFYCTKCYVAAGMPLRY